MALQVSGKTALVTGGGSGICLAFTTLLLSKSCKVLIVDLTLTPDAEKLVQENKGKVAFKKTDVTNWAQLREAFETAISEFGSLDIVCPGAGIFEPPWSNFWQLHDTIDTDSTNSYKTLEINVTHPIRATQLAIDSFKRQKHGHGVVVLISSIAAQMALVPAPLYAASKAAISSFARSLAPLEQVCNIRVNAVAPAIVQTPIWTPDKLLMMDEEKDLWIKPQRIAEMMLQLVEKKEYVGGTVLEVGLERNRLVERLNDPGPPAEEKGHTVSKIMDVVKSTFALIESQFGK